MTRIKRHHTVPCSYLKWFVESINEKDSRKSLIDVYDRKNDEYRKQPLDNTSVITDFYTVENEQWEKIDILEKMLWDEVDSKISKIVEKIDSELFLSEEEENDLFLFIAFQKERTEVDIVWEKKAEEEFRKHIFMMKYLHWGKEELKRTLDKVGVELSEDELEEQYNFIVSWEWDAQISNNGYLMKHMLDKVILTYEFLRSFKYVIFKAQNNKSFITSDDPYCMTAPIENRFPGGGVWFATPWLEIHIPLSKKSCLFMTNWDKLKISWFYPIPDDLLEAYNKRSCANSYRYVLWDSKELLKSLVEWTNSKWLWEFKHKISTPLSRAEKRKWW